MLEIIGIKYLVFYLAAIFPVALTLAIIEEKLRRVNKKGKAKPRTINSDYRTPTMTTKTRNYYVK